MNEKNWPFSFTNGKKISNSPTLEFFPQINKFYNFLKIFINILHFHFLNLSLNVFNLDMWQQ